MGSMVYEVERDFWEMVFLVFEFFVYFWGEYEGLVFIVILSDVDVILLRGGSWDLGAIGGKGLREVLVFRGLFICILLELVLVVLLKLLFI